MTGGFTRFCSAKIAYLRDRGLPKHRQSPVPLKTAGRVRSSEGETERDKVVVTRLHSSEDLKLKMFLPPTMPLFSLSELHPYHMVALPRGSLNPGITQNTL